jgi:hypothetical protein
MIGNYNYGKEKQVPYIYESDYFIIITINNVRDK